MSAADQVVTEEPKAKQIKATGFVLGAHGERIERMNPKKGSFHIEIA